MDTHSFEDIYLKAQVEFKINGNFFESIRLIRLL